MHIRTCCSPAAAASKVPSSSIPAASSAKTSSPPPSSPPHCSAASSSGTTHNPTFFRQGQLDDLGRFRIAGLPPGQYRLSLRLTESYLAPNIVNNQLLGFTTSRAGTGALTVYAPSVLSRAKATLLSVKNGDTLAGIDLTVPLRQLHTIRGTVLRQGNPVAGVSVMLRKPSQPLSLDSGDETLIPDAITGQDGVFVFDLVPSGPFRVIATSLHHTTPGTPNPTTEATVTLGDSAPPDLLLTLPPSTPAHR